MWMDRSSWVWMKNPAFANDYARVFLFGMGDESQPERTNRSTLRQ